LGELVAVTQEMVGGDSPHPESHQELLAIPGVRLGGDDFTWSELGDVPGVARFETGGVPVIDLEPVASQIVGESAHGGEHQMGALAVPGLRREFGGGLNHEHPSISR
jgi:hypothetical protein